jgi:hypothetical protein
MQIILTLLIIAVTGFVVYRIIKTNPAKPMQLPARSATPYEPTLPQQAPARHLSDGGRFLVEVVNESRYQGALKELAGAHGDQAAAAPYLATLLLDDLNPYESAAVAVFLNGRMTGYLSQKASVKFRENLKRDEIEGKLTTCDAQVRGGGLWEGKRLAYIVALDMETLEK